MRSQSIDPSFAFNGVVVLGFQLADSRIFVAFVASTSMVKESAEVSASSLIVGIPGMEGVAAAEEEWFSIVGVWPLAPSPTPIMGGPSKYGLTFANLETKIQTLPEIKIALLKIRNSQN